jgi:RNA polymerase sigma-70 factor (ECF subfamily)
MIKKAQLEFGSHDDITLVNNAKQGDIEAFEELIGRHTDMIFCVAMQITRSHEDAEDVAQNAFLKAFQHLQHFEERARFSTWLTRIAINEALMKLRRPRRVPMISIDNEAEEFGSVADKIADCKPNPEQVYSRVQLKGILQQALASLPDAYRVVFQMREVEGLSTADTAELLELSVPSVKARLLRARRKLRKGLSHHIDHSRSATESLLPLESRAA